MLRSQNEKATTKAELTEEQLKENQAKLDEYERIFKIAVVAIALMFAVIVCIVLGLVINSN